MKLIDKQGLDRNLRLRDNYKMWDGRHCGEDIR